MADSIAQAIAESQLESFYIDDNSELYRALLRTTPIKDLDFSFSRIVQHGYEFKINRNWKSLLRADIPLGLWPEVFVKAQSTTSHGPVGILFFLLREKPELVQDFDP